MIDADDRADLLEHLSALNDNLQALGVAPLVTIQASKALRVENLREAVWATGDYLIDTARKLRGT